MVEQPFGRLRTERMAFQLERPLCGSRADDANRPLDTGWYPVIKRGADVAVSLLAMVALGPFLLLLAALIYLDDPSGSPLYVQDRVGKGGRLFRFYKFRSMCVDADRLLNGLLEKNEADGPAFKMKNDPRVTRVGRWIRKCSLDELPQLYNILRGDMSLVGPRPPLPHEVVKYDARQMLRLSVKPGLTCYWQTRPSRNSATFDEWMSMDLRYVYNRTLWLDLTLILKTFKVMVMREGV